MQPLDPSSKPKSLYKRIFRAILFTFAFLLVIALLAPKDKSTVANQSEPASSARSASAPVSETRITEASRRGIGKSRSTFVDALPMVNFERGKDIDGQPNYIGQKGVALFQLIGPEEDLTQASLTVGVTTADEENAKTLGVLMGSFANIIVPNSNEWFAKNVTKSVTASRPIEKRFGKVTASLSTVIIGENMFVTLAFKHI